MELTGNGGLGRYVEKTYKNKNVSYICSSFLGEQNIEHISTLYLHLTQGLLS